MSMWTKLFGWSRSLRKRLATNHLRRLKSPMICDICDTTLLKVWRNKKAFYRCPKCKALQRALLEEIYAYVVGGDDEGSEGVLFCETPMGRMPMFATSRDSVEQFRPLIVKLVDSGNSDVRLVRFTGRTVLEVLSKDSKGRLQ